jgi:hypothetical protein
MIFFSVHMPGKTFTHHRIAERIRVPWYRVLLHEWKRQSLPLVFARFDNFNFQFMRHECSVECS